MLPPSTLASHLLAALLPFLLVLTLARAAPEPHALVALPQPQHTRKHFATPTPQPSPPVEINHDVLPFVIVSTIDGALHAIDRATGAVKWVLRDGVEPLVGGGVRGKGNEEEYIVEPLSGGLYVFDQEDKDTKEAPKIRKLPLSVEQLIELSPFTFPHSPSRIFTGSKHTSLLTIDLRTGEQIDCFSPSAFNLSHHDHDHDFEGDPGVCETERMLDDLEGRSPSSRDTLFVGRTDYRLMIHTPAGAASSPGTAGATSTVYRTPGDATTGSDGSGGATSSAPNSGSGGSTGGASKKGGVQEIGYSTYTPNSFDRPLADFWAKTGLHGKEWDGKAAGAGAGSEGRIRIELQHDGSAVGVSPDGGPNGGFKWVRQLDGIGIAVYDILVPLDSNSANPILVPQPPPHIPSIFPAPSDPNDPRHALLAKPPSTYIGSVPFRLALPPSSGAGAPAGAGSNGSGANSRGRGASHAPPTPQPRPLLYALSSNAYPLVRFAPPPRPGVLANGSFVLAEDLPERDQLLPWTIDPPDELGLVEGGKEVGGREGKGEDEVWVRGGKERRGGKGWGWPWMVALAAGLIVAILSLAGALRSPRAVLASPVSEESAKLALGEKQALLPAGDNTGAASAAGESSTREEKPDPSSDGSPLDPTQPPTTRSIDLTTDSLPPIPTAPSADGDETTLTPKKKNARRRVRGKKKPKDGSAGPSSGLALAGGAGAEEGDEDDEDEGSSSTGRKPNPTQGKKGGNGAVTPTMGMTPKKGDKPLPDLPREMSSTDLMDMDDKERLAISDTVIGYGSHGTVVLKGTWGGRPVAVKRLLSDFTRLASQEVKLLQASDDHPNVIRYYCQEKRDNFLYIALDLCQASLADLIDTPEKYQELANALDRKKALAQVTAGLKHLHGMKIIHRDIKPQNVLVSRAASGLRMLVSDFGLARRLDQGQSSFAPTGNNLAGSLGWRAPECIKGQVRLNEGVAFEGGGGSSFSSLSSGGGGSGGGVAAGAGGDDAKPTKLTKAVDLFALGCLYFWVLMSGEHPFGETYNRESNIVKGEAVNMGMLDILGEEGEEAKELVGRLLDCEPGNRPDTTECLIHPLFWNPNKRLNFLCDASDRFEIMELDPPEATLVLLEKDASDVVGKDWYARLDRTFTQSLGKYRKYKGKSVRDLLRALRNKKHHYQDLEPEVKLHMGDLPTGFLQYFTVRYPKLFLHVHRIVRESQLKDEGMFEGYFQEI
ncbi:hypothetical protein IAT38_000263 [Cryptococcus sp. DSM 104549]